MVITKHESGFSSERSDEGREIGRIRAAHGEGHGVFIFEFDASFIQQLEDEDPMAVMALAQSMIAAAEQLQEDLKQRPGMGAIPLPPSGVN